MERTQPRNCSYFGMRSEASRMALGTWLEPEELTYPSGAMLRKALAFNTETGKRQVVKCGIPDTYFSIRASRGYLTVSDGGVLLYHPSKNQ